MILAVISPLLHVVDGFQLVHTSTSRRPLGIWMKSNSRLTNRLATRREPVLGIWISVGMTGKPRNELTAVSCHSACMTDVVSLEQKLPGVSCRCRRITDVSLQSNYHDSPATLGVRLKSDSNRITRTLLPLWWYDWSQFVSHRDTRTILPPWWCDSSQFPIELPGLSCHSDDVTEVSLSLIELPGLSCYPGGVTKVSLQSSYRDSLVVLLKSVSSRVTRTLLPLWWCDWSQSVSNWVTRTLLLSWWCDSSQSPIELPGLSGSATQISFQSSYPDSPATQVVWS